MASYAQIAQYSFSVEREDGTTKTFRMTFEEKNGSPLSLDVPHTSELIITDGEDNDSPSKPIKVSQAEFVLKGSGSTLISKIVEAGLRDIRVTIEDTVASTEEFKGYVVRALDTFKLYKDTKEIKVRCIGALGDLSGVDVDAITNRTFYHVVNDALTDIDLTRPIDFYTSLDHTGRTGASGLPQELRFDERVAAGPSFGPGKTVNGVQDGKKTLDALRGFLVPLGWQMFQDDGRMIIMDIYDRVFNRSAVNKWEDDGAGNYTQGSEDVRFSLDETNVVAWGDVTELVDVVEYDHIHSFLNRSNTTNISITSTQTVSKDSELSTQPDDGMIREGDTIEIDTSLGALTLNTDPASNLTGDVGFLRVVLFDRVSGNEYHYDPDAAAGAKWKEGTTKYYWTQSYNFAAGGGAGQEISFGISNEVLEDPPDGVIADIFVYRTNKLLDTSGGTTEINGADHDELIVKFTEDQGGLAASRVFRADGTPTVGKKISSSFTIGDEDQYFDQSFLYDDGSPTSRTSNWDDGTRTGLLGDVVGERLGRVLCGAGIEFSVVIRDTSRISLKTAFQVKDNDGNTRVCYPIRIRHRTNEGYYEVRLREAFDGFSAMERERYSSDITSGSSGAVSSPSSGSSGGITEQEADARYLKRDGTNTVTDWIDFEEVSTPADPSADTARVYAADEAGFTALHHVDAAGNDYEFSRDLRHIVRNESGATLSKGDVVYVTGSNGNYPTVEKASASSMSTLPVFGVVVDDISNNSFGEVLQEGDLSGIDLSAFTEGDTVFVSATAGNISTTEPTGDSIPQIVGTVIKATASGILEVSIGAPLDFNQPNLNASFANLDVTTLTATGLASLDGGIDVNGGAFTVATSGAIDGAAGSFIAATSGVISIQNDNGYLRLARNATGAYGFIGTSTNTVGSGSVTDLGIRAQNNLYLGAGGTGIDLQITSSGAVSTPNSFTASGLASLDGGIDVNGSNFTVGTSGNTSIAGTLGVTGLTTATGGLTVPSGGVLRLEDTTDVTLASTGHAFQIGLDSGENLAADANEIQARNNGVADTLNLNNDGGLVRIGAGTGGGLTVNGALTANDNILSDLFDNATWAGAGWRGQDTGDWVLESLRVRGRLEVYEFVAKQIMSIGGKEILSIGNGRIESIDSGAGTIDVQDVRGQNATSFKAGDLWVVQVVDVNNDLESGGTGSIVRSAHGTISSVVGNTLTLSFTSGTISDLERNDLIVLYGSSDSNRNAIMYRNVDRSDDNLIMRVQTGVTTFGALTDPDNTAVAFGDLYGSAGTAYSDYASTTYGFFAGDNTGAHLTIDPTNGVRFIDGAASNAVLAALAPGSFYVGEGSGAGNNRVEFDGTDFEVEVENLQFTSEIVEGGGSKFLYLQNTEVTSATQRNGRGLTVYTDNALLSDGSVKSIRIGQLTDQDTVQTFGATPNYGIQVQAVNDPGGTPSYTDIFRADSAGVEFFGWSANGESLYKVQTGVEVSLGTPQQWSSSVLGFQAGVDVNNRIWVGELSGDYEMRVVDSGNNIVQLGSVANKIGQIDISDVGLSTGAGDLGAYTAGTVTGLQRRTASTTRTFFSGADDKSGTNATFYVQANGKIFHDSIGAIIYSRTEVAGFSAGDTASSITDQYHVSTASLNTDGSDDSTFEVKVYTVFLKRFGANNLIATFKADQDRVSGSTPVSTGHTSEIKVTVTDLVTSGTNSTTQSIGTTEQVYSVEIGMTNITDGNPVLLEIASRAALTLSNGDGNTYSTTTKLREDITVQTAT